jgi:uncharacterized Tic20 family protein
VATDPANVRTWTVLVHAIALIGFFVPIGGHIVGPLVIWLAKRDDSPQIDAHGRESVNFQVSMLIYNAIAGILCFFLIGFFLLGVLHILNVVFVIIASIRASDGKRWEYPLALRLIK